MTTDPEIAEAVRYLMNKDELVRAPKRDPLPTPIISGGVSRPAWLTVDPGYDTLGANGDDVFWSRVVSDPDHILNWDISEPDYVRFNTPGLYLIDWQIHISWDVPVSGAGYVQWQLLSDLWKDGTGAPIRPWQGDFIWTVNSTSTMGASYFIGSGTHLVEVVDIVNDLYILLWDLWDMEPFPFIDLDTGYVWGFGEDWDWTWVKAVRLNQYEGVI